MDCPDIRMMTSSENPADTLAVPSVGVMLATYNGEKFLAEQIDSLLGQQGVATTLYVRDDGSGDCTVDILRAYAETHPSRIVLLADAPRRFGAACENFLSILSEVHGAPHAYFAFSDQDDIWLPEKLARAIRRLRVSGASGYASNLTAFSDADKREWTIAKAGPQRPFDHLFQSASAGCTYVFDANAARLIASRIGRIEDHDWKGMSHDWLCYAICRSHGLAWVIDDWSGIRYRQHDENQFGALPGLGGAMTRLALIRDGWYRGVLLRNRPFLRPDNEKEQTILDRVARLGPRDRLWLAANSGRFRRERKAGIVLSASWLLGLI